jgi:O-antigen/teichoic acid export membrane protein
MRSATSHWPLTILSGGMSLVNLFMPLLLVRILTDPNQIGLYKIYFLYISLIPWLCLVSGLTNGLSHWAGKDDEFQKTFRITWTILLAVGLGVLVLGLSVSQRIQTYLNWSNLNTQLLIVGVFFTILGDFFDHASISSGRIVRGAVYGAVFDFLRNAAVAFAAYKYRSIEAIFVAYVTVIGIRTLIGVAWGRVDGFQLLEFDPKTIRKVLKYAFPVSIAGALSIATGYSDQLILTTLLTPARFAIYSFGCLTVPILAILEQSVNRVLIPSMSKAFVRQDSAAAKALFRDAVSEMGWLLIPSAAGLIIFARPIILMLFTERYAASVFFLRIYAVSYAINSLPYDSVARAEGNGSWILRRLGFFAVLTVAMIYAAAYFFGATGALVGLITTNFLLRSSSMYSVHRSKGWPLREMLPWKDWGLYIGLSLVASAVAVSSSLILGTRFAWLVGGGLAFSVVYLAGTYSTFRKRLDRHQHLSSEVINV